MRHFRFDFGNWNCHVLEDRNKVIPIIQEFDPDKQKQALHCHLSHGAKDENVEIGYNYLFIDTGSVKILIDAGLSDRHLIQSMESAGIQPQDVDHVIITHGDDDHIDGLALFPNAHFIIPERTYQLWTNHETRQMLNEEFEKALSRVITSDRVASGIENRHAFGQRLSSHLQPRLIRIEDDKEFLPGMRMIYTPGHRSDHYSVLLENGQRTMIALSDAIRHGFQMKRTHLSSKYDSNEDEWTGSLEKIKARDPEGQFLYFATHFSFPGLKTFQDGLLLDAPSGTL